MLATTLLSVGLLAADPQPDSEPRSWQRDVLPVGHLYPGYVADPRRPRFGLATMWVSDSEIAGVGDRRVDVRLGGRYGLLRLHRNGEAERGFQIDFEAGFAGQFDSDNSTDNIGWDGFYGIDIAWAPRKKLALRFGLFHDSSHIGDELIESTGQTRIDYTREEYFVGVSAKLTPLWRTYVETGYGYDLRNSLLQDRWRAQSGLEFETPARIWGDRFGWFAAADFVAFEEDDWDVGVTVQGGVVHRQPDSDRTFRAGVEWYDGRSRIGEFFRDEERFVSAGLWFEL